MGWMFDTMAQQLFNLARKPAIRELLGGRASDATVSEQAGYATMVFMIGWALGGVVFGILGDRLGRAKTMIMTILCYTIFTGLSVLSTGVWDFNAVPLPVRPGRRRAVRRGRGAGGRGGARARAPVRPGHGAGVLGGRQYDGRAGGHPARADGDVRRHRGGLALGVSRRRAARAAGPARLQEVERARTVAQGPRRKETHGVVRRAVLRPALAPQFDCRLPAGLRRRGGPVGHRHSSATTCSARCSNRLSARKVSPAPSWPARPPPGSASPPCSRTWEDSSASTPSPG